LDSRSSCCRFWFKRLHLGEPERSTAIQSQVKLLRTSLAASQGTIFTYIPLKEYFRTVAFGATALFVRKYGAGSVEDQMGFDCVQFQIHKRGPCVNGKTPPAQDLTAGEIFERGLRPQSAMTPLLAIMHVGTISEYLDEDTQPHRLYIFPHALVLETQGLQSTHGKLDQLDLFFERLGIGQARSWRRGAGEIKSPLGLRVKMDSVGRHRSKSLRAT
jgi:hypothetical protein